MNITQDILTDRNEYSVAMFEGKAIQRIRRRLIVSKCLFGICIVLFLAILTNAIWVKYLGGFFEFSSAIGFGLTGRFFLLQRCSIYDALISFGCLLQRYCICNALGSIGRLLQSCCICDAFIPERNFRLPTNVPINHQTFHLLKKTMHLPVPASKWIATAILLTSSNNK